MYSALEWPHLISSTLCILESAITGIYPNDSKKDGEKARGHNLRGTAEYTMFVLLSERETEG